MSGADGWIFRPSAYFWGRTQNGVPKRTNDWRDKDGPKVGENQNDLWDM